MLRRAVITTLLLCWAGAAFGVTVADATGRSVEVPEQITCVLPAGLPAAILSAALAPDLMLGWAYAKPDNASSLLAPEAARLPLVPRPLVPRLTGCDDVTDKVAALRPDLILDYCTVAPRYIYLATAPQQRTGVPTVLLDRSLSEVPQVLRLLAGILHPEQRAEVLAKFSEALLALPQKRDIPLRVVCARGPDGLTLAMPGADLAEPFTSAGFQLVAPAGDKPSRQATLEDIRALDPDVIVFTDPAMRSTLAQSATWRSLRAVRDGRAFVAPEMPFGWLDEPPSINRLLGLAWLSGSDPRGLAATFNAVIYGQALTALQLDTLLADARTIQP